MFYASNLISKSEVIFSWQLRGSDCTDKSQKRLWPQHAHEIGTRDVKRLVKGRGVRGVSGIRSVGLFSVWGSYTSAWRAKDYKAALRGHRIDIDSHLVLPRAPYLWSTAPEIKERRARAADFDRKLAEREKRSVEGREKRNWIKTVQRLVMPMRDASQLKRNECRAAMPYRVPLNAWKTYM